LFRARYAGGVAATLTASVSLVPPMLPTAGTYVGTNGRGLPASCGTKR
jgi:hypothetical protein